jgi:DNA-binding protein YbaB
MQATAEAVDEFAVRARDFNASLARRIITREIEPGLGIVAVTGSGDLVDVRFNVDGIRTADPARLGERLLRAMNIAEEKIRGIRERGLENISKTTIGEWE